MITKLTKKQFEDKLTLEISSRESNKPKSDDFESLAEELRQLLDEHGEEQWDYFLEYSIPELFVTYLVINNRHVANFSTLKSLHHIIKENKPWALKVEVYDNVEDGNMIAGEDLGEVFYTNEGGFWWGSILD